MEPADAKSKEISSRGCSLTLNLPLGTVETLPCLTLLSLKNWRAKIDQLGDLEPKWTDQSKHGAYMYCTEPQIENGSFQIGAWINALIRRFFMVPPCGFLFLRFCGDCALNCEHWCAFLWKIAPCKATSVFTAWRSMTLNDAKWC